MPSERFDFDPDDIEQDHDPSKPINMNEYISAMSQDTLPPYMEAVETQRNHAEEDVQWKIKECRRVMDIFRQRGDKIPQSTYERLEELHVRLDNMRSNVQRRVSPNIIALHALKKLRDRMHYLGIDCEYEWKRVKIAYNDAHSGEYPEHLMDQIRLSIDQAIGGLSEAA